MDKSRLIISLFLTNFSTVIYDAVVNELKIQTLMCWLKHNFFFFLKEWIPVLKNQMLNVISNLKPHFDFLSFETIEVYYASKKILVSYVVKLQSSATTFMQVKIKLHNLFFFFFFFYNYLVAISPLWSYHFWQELHKYAKPYMNQIATVAKIYLDTALVSIGILVKKIIIFLHDLWNDWKD